MSDLISRKAVYEKACAGCTRHGDKPGECYHDEPCERLLFEFTTAPAVGWIPVTERLPEESGQYIVCCDDSGCPDGEGIWYRTGVVVCAQADVGLYGGICWEWYDGHNLYDLEGVVTHWMPMPEPPKEV